MSGNGSGTERGSGLFIVGRRPGEAGSVNSFTGSITGNTVADNKGSGIYLDSLSFNGTVSHNNGSGHMRGQFQPDNSHLRAGLSLSLMSGSGRGFYGDISDNHFFNNDRGIEILASEMTGNIVSNEIDNNHISAGIFVGWSSSYSGRIEQNIVNESGTNGLSVNFDTTFEGEISNNTFTSNGAEGMLVQIDGEAAEDFDVQVVNNSLMGNNGGSAREVIVRNTGSGTLNLALSGNSSTNIVPAGQFNFDLQNNGAGTFNVTPNDVDAANDPGTVGSSNDTVNIP